MDIKEAVGETPRRVIILSHLTRQLFSSDIKIRVIHQSDLHMSNFKNSNYQIRQLLTFSFYIIPQK